MLAKASDEQEDIDGRRFVFANHNWKYEIEKPNCDGANGDKLRDRKR